MFLINLQERGFGDFGFYLDSIVKREGTIVRYWRANYSTALRVEMNVVESFRNVKSFPDILDNCEWKEIMLVIFYTI